MNRSINKSRFALHVVSAVALTLVAAAAQAQDTTTTSIRHGESLIETNVRNAEIVYVEGNDLVVKLENGKIEHMVVPSSERFKIDGRNVSVNDLTPGTKLTQKVTTTTTPHVVSTVRVLKGNVWHVSAPHSVIVTLPDHTNQMFKVPSNAKFTVNGEPKTVFDLRKGMAFEATIVSDEPGSVVQSNKTTVGRSAEPTLPSMLGVLLFQQTVPMPEAIAANVVAEQVDPPAALPDTASSTPLIGLLGLLGIASSFGLGVARKFAKFNA